MSLLIRDVFVFRAVHQQSRAANGVTSKADSPRCVAAPGGQITTEESGSTSAA